MARGGKVIFYEPGKKYSVSCPEFGAVSVVLPEGERVQAINSGNSGEWMVQQTTTGLEEPFPVIAIRRAPWAPSAELQVITDAAIYQFLLHPQQRSVSKEQISLIVVVNPETEARRAERAAARAREQERRRREQTERMPQEEFSLLGRQQ
jgi:hypothetical protein